MKIYNLAIPVFLAFFLASLQPFNLTTNSESKESTTVEMVEKAEVEAVIKKQVTKPVTKIIQIVILVPTDQLPKQESQLLI